MQGLGSLRGMLAVVLGVGLAQVPALAKSRPYSMSFENRVSQLFLENQRPSIPKINSYLQRLKQKQIEIGGIIAGSEKMSGERNSDKIQKKIDKSQSLIALQVAMDELEKMKNVSSNDEMMDLAYSALDIESSLRIEGKEIVLKELWNKVSTFMGEWKIPVSSASSEEATNLFNPVSNSYLSVAEIEQLKVQNKDLSQYSPKKGSSFWQVQADISKISVSEAAWGRTLDFYQNAKIQVPEQNVFYYDEMKYSDTKPKMDVFAYDQKNKKLKYKLKFGEEIHSEPTVSALMLTLGYGADIDVYKRDIKLVLGKKTKSDLIKEWEIYYPREGGLKSYQIEKYITESGVDPELGNYLVFKEGLIEVRPDGVERLGGWGFSENGNDSLREVRALMLVQMWLDNTDLREFENNRLMFKEKSSGGIERFHIISDLGHTLGLLFQEMPDIYSSKMVDGRSSRSIDMKYRTVHKNGLKNKLTYADVKWASRLIAQLSREQITQAVALGNWPQCVQEIYVEKMISRRNDLAFHFGLLGEVQKNRKTIELIPLLRDPKELQTDKICNAQEIKSDYSYGFNSDLGIFLKPIAKGVWNGLLDFARQAAGSKAVIVLKSSEFGDHLTGVSEVIFRVRREIERNPQPLSDKDLYLVKDELRVGLRLGISYGPFVDTVYNRKFTLVYPTRSLEEARYNKGFIVNVLLPKDVGTGSLPESYVLKTEHYLEKGAGLELNLDGSILSPVFKAGIAQVNLWRSIYDHRDPQKYILYRDRSDFTQQSLEAFVRLAIFKIPVFKTLSQWGQAKGKGSVFLKDESDVLKAVVDGNFENIEKKEKEFFISNQFHQNSKNWNFLFWKGSSLKRLDKIQLSGDDIQSKNLQYKTTKETFGNFLFSKIDQKKINVEVYTEPEVKDQFQININVLGVDGDTKDKEMSKSYLQFINGLTADDHPVIQLSPELGYTTNGHWGATVTMSDSSYSTEALNIILNASTSDFWHQMAQKMKLSNAQFEEFRNTVRTFLQERNQNSVMHEKTLLKNFGLTRNQVDLVTHSEDFLKRLQLIKSEANKEKKIQALAEAFRKAIYFNQEGFYESGILGVLNGLVGSSNFYSRNIITAPQFTEVNMLEETPLFGEIGTPLLRNLKYLIFSPETALDLYTMFDSWF